MLDRRRHGRLARGAVPASIVALGCVYGQSLSSARNHPIVSFECVCSVLDLDAVKNRVARLTGTVSMGRRLEAAVAE